MFIRTTLALSACSLAFGSAQALANGPHPGMPVHNAGDITHAPYPGGAKQGK